MLKMKDFYCHIDRFCGDGLPNIMGNPVTSHTFMDRFYLNDSEGVPRASFDAARSSRRRTIILTHTMYYIYMGLYMWINWIYILY